MLILLSLYNTLLFFFFFFFFNDTATTEIYTLSLHDALPIFLRGSAPVRAVERLTPRRASIGSTRVVIHAGAMPKRSEEHTSELQSPVHLVCRLLLEKKKKKNISIVNANHIIEMA